jgi:hypothetical protein
MCLLIEVPDVLTKDGPQSCIADTAGEFLSRNCEEHTIEHADDEAIDSCNRKYRRPEIRSSHHFLSICE